MTTPFFSIIIPAYNRATMIGRAVQSCLDQTDPDLEVVVVDDASTDGTADAVRAIGDPRVILVQHAENRGIGPARNTAAAHARGEWVVALDSDWELLPHCLARFRELAAEAAPDVGAVGGRLRWDDGHVTPPFVPNGPVDYEGRIRWIEAGGGADALHCRRRSTLETVAWYFDGRGSVEAWTHLEFVRRFKQYFVADVLGLEHSDAPNSITRGAGRGDSASRLRNAADLAVAWERMLADHGDAMRRWAPRWYATVCRIAALQHFLLGRRLRGARRIAAYIRTSPGDVAAWGTLGVGMLGPRATAAAAGEWRGLRSRRLRPQSGREP